MKENQKTKTKAGRIECLMSKTGPVVSKSFNFFHHKSIGRMGKKKKSKPLTVTVGGSDDEIENENSTGNDTKEQQQSDASSLKETDPKTKNKSSSAIETSNNTSSGTKEEESASGNEENDDDDGDQTSSSTKGENKHQIQLRHKQELKDLKKNTDDMLKKATGANKKDIKQQIKQMELDIDQRHKTELESLQKEVA
jgi:hypothetical protein